MGRPATHNGMTGRPRRSAGADDEEGSAHSGLACLTGTPSARTIHAPLVERTRSPTVGMNKGWLVSVATKGRCKGARPCESN
jgi:hypothetical protein